jgi:hypothetical protein
LSQVARRTPCCPPGRFVVVLFLSLVLLGIPADSFAVDGDNDSRDNFGLGYLTAPSLSPGHILRPSSLFVLPVSGPAGSRWVDLDVHWANVWDYAQDKYLIDGEWIRSNVRLTYARTDTLSAGVALPIVGRIGGFADPLIESFHNTFHLGNSHRDEFPQNHALVNVRTDGAIHTVAEGNAWGIGDVSGFVASRISNGTRVLPAITLQAQLSLPTGNKDELQGIGAAALAMGAVASKRLGDSPFIVFGGLGSQYCPSDNIAGLELHRMEWSGLGGVSYQYTPSLALIVQYLGSSPVARDAYAFSDPCHEVSGGFKWRTTDYATLEFALVENVATFKNSADIGAHLCFGLKF